MSPSTPERDFLPRAPNLVIGLFAVAGGLFFLVLPGGGASSTPVAAASAADFSEIAEYRDRADRLTRLADPIAREFRREERPEITAAVVAMLRGSPEHARLGEAGEETLSRWRDGVAFEPRLRWSDDPSHATLEPKPFALYYVGSDRDGARRYELVFETDPVGEVRMKKAFGRWNVVGVSTPKDRPSEPEVARRERVLQAWDERYGDGL